MKGKGRLVCVNQNRIGKPSVLLFGILLSLLMTLIGSGILAKLMNSEVLTEDAIGYGAVTIVMLSSWIGAMTVNRKRSGKRILNCLVVAGGYLLTLLGINGLFFDGQYRGVAVTALLVFGGSFLALLTNLPEKRVGKTPKIKIPNR